MAYRAFDKYESHSYKMKNINLVISDNKTKEKARHKSKIYRGFS